MPEATAETLANSTSTRGDVGRGDASDRNTLLFDLDGIDLSRRLLDREQLQAWIPHRGVMQLLDSVTWISDTFPNVSNSRSWSCVSVCCAASFAQLPKPEAPTMALAAMPTCRKSRREIMRRSVFVILCYPFGKRNVFG